MRKSSKNSKKISDRHSELSDIHDNISQPRDETKSNSVETTLGCLVRFGALNGLEKIQLRHQGIPHPAERPLRGRAVSQ